MKKVNYREKECVKESGDEMVSFFFKWGEVLFYYLGL